MLPDLQGVEVCRLLKADPKTRTTPVIILTARGEEGDRVVGFEIGADDYVTKPFSVRELVLPVRAVLRRGEPTSGRPAGVSKFGQPAIDSETHRLPVEGR